jgi:hypothetical protein
LSRRSAVKQEPVEHSGAGDHERWKVSYGYEGGTSEHRPLPLTLDNAGHLVEVCIATATARPEPSGRRP